MGGRLNKDIFVAHCENAKKDVIYIEKKDKANFFHIFTSYMLNNFNNSLII